MDLTKQDIENYNKIHAQMCRDNGYIDVGLYDEYGVKRGLRDKNGKGVLAGLTSLMNLRRCLRVCAHFRLISQEI